MQTGPPKHPSQELLAGFAQGRLGEADQTLIESHVAHCDTCCEYLLSVENDELGERLRVHGTPPQPGETRAMPQPARVVSGSIPKELADHPRYRILRVLGAGGMGVVYHAEHRLMERPVALKVINPGLMRNALAVERFRIEVKGAARLAHPNIVAAYDAEQAGEFHFLVMEYVEGASLAHVVAKRGRLPVVHACNYVRQAAQGLQHAFEKETIHRDIKPANLMLTRTGRIKILDFGLARFAREQQPEAAVAASESTRADLTAAGDTLGTPDYIAPEQISDSRSVGIQADIYSLGATFYFLLGGQPPFPQGTIADKLAAHRMHEPLPINVLRPEVPAEVAAIVHRMLEKNPANRFETPAAVAAALAPFSKASDASLAQAATTAIAVEPVAVTPFVEYQPSRTRRKPQRKRPTSAISLIAIAAVIGAIAFAVWKLQPVDKTVAVKDKEGNAPAPVQVGPNGPPAPPMPAVTPSELAVPSRPAWAADFARVLIVVPQRNLYYPDYGQVVAALDRRRPQVKYRVASSTLDDVQPNQNSPGGRDVIVKPEVRLDFVRGLDYDAIIFTGASPMAGMEFLARGPLYDPTQRVIGDMLKGGMCVSAICGGIAVLGDAGALNGKSSAFNRYADEAMQPGHGIVWDRSRTVVAAGPIITASDAANAEPFVDAVLRQIKRSVGQVDSGSN